MAAPAKLSPFARDFLRDGMDWLEEAPNDEARFNEMRAVCAVLLGHVLTESRLNGWPDAEVMPERVCYQLQKGVETAVEIGLLARRNVQRMLARHGLTPSSDGLA